MNLAQLTYVVAAAEEETFTAAAARVHVAQPAISQQIAQLERELGERLFDRSERRVRLTPAGEAFLPHARAALEAASAGRDVVESLRGELTGRLTIGTIPSPPPWLLGQLADFRRRYPKVRLTLRTDDPEPLAAGVATGALDGAVIGVAAARLPAGPAGQRLRPVLASQTIATEPLVVAVPADHDLARAAETSVRRLRDESLVTLNHGTGLRAVLESACAGAGFTPQIQAETDALSVVAELVAHGLGVALLPRSAAERGPHGVVMVRLREKGLQRRMVLIWHRQRVSVPGEAFLAAARAHDETSPPDNDRSGLPG
jgi:DNA-binding transcriptional LysR family regulator